MRIEWKPRAGYCYRYYSSTVAIKALIPSSYPLSTDTFLPFSNPPVPTPSIHPSPSPFLHPPDPAPPSHQPTQGY